MDALAGAPERARLVVTCRSVEDFARDFVMLRRSGGAFDGGRTPFFVPFDKFTESELRALLRANFPDLERILLRDEGVEDEALNAFGTANFSLSSIGGNAPRHPLVEVILDPVMWRSFCVVSDDIRARLVAGHHEEERELAKYFCDRFIEKARVRTLIPRATITTALASIAADHQSQGRRFRTNNQWLQSARDLSGLSVPEARQLAFEAASGGLIREEGRSRWDWRNDAVELHLASLFVP